MTQGKEAHSSTSPSLYTQQGAHTHIIYIIFIVSNAARPRNQNGRARFSRTIASPQQHAAGFYSLEKRASSVRDLAKKEKSCVADMFLVVLCEASD